MTTTTKTIREIQYLSPDGQILNLSQNPIGQNKDLRSREYELLMRNSGNYAEYPHKAPTPPTPSERSFSPPPENTEPGKIKDIFSFIYDTNCCILSNQ